MRGASKVTLQTHQILRLPRNLEAQDFSGYSLNASANRKTIRGYPRISDDNPNTKSSSRTRRFGDLTLPILETILYCKIQHFALRLSPKMSRNAAPATKSHPPTSPQILRLPRKMNRILHPHRIWNVISNARSQSSHPPTSANTALNASANRKTIRGYPRISDDNPNTKSSSRTRRFGDLIRPILETILYCKIQHFASRLSPKMSRSAAPATQNECHHWSASHMKRHFQCAEQVKSPSNLTKYCAYHEILKLKISADTPWMLPPIERRFEDIRRYPTIIRTQNRHLAPAASGTLLVPSWRRFCIVKYNISRPGYLPKCHEVLRLPRKVTRQPHQILRLPRKMNVDFTELLLYWSVTLLIYYFAELLLYWSVTLLIYYFTELLLALTVTLLICYFTDLLLYWTVTLLICYFTDLLLYRSITLLNCYFTDRWLYWSITVRNCYLPWLLLDLTVTLLICYFTDLLLYWTVTSLICYFTELLLYWSVTLLICYFTDLSLYWTVTLLICYFTDLLLYETITLLMCFFTELLLYGSISLRNYYFTDLLLYETITLLMCFFTKLLLYWCVSLRNYYFTDVFLYGTITLLIYYFTKLLLYGSITLRNYYFTDVFLYETITLRIYYFTKLLLYWCVSLRNYYFTDLLLYETITLLMCFFTELLLYWSVSLSIFKSS